MKRKRCGIKTCNYTHLFFKSFNNKIVKCFLEDEFLCKTFIGTASCNTEAGDVYEESIGMRLAYRRAAKDREKVLMKSLREMANRFDSEISVTTEVVNSKVLAGKLTCLSITNG